MRFSCFLILSITILTGIESLAAKPKRILSGEEVEQFEAFIKDKEGNQYGFGGSQSDVGKLMWLIVAQAVAWIFVMGTKVWEWARGDKDKVKSAISESKEYWLKAAHDIAYIKQHMQTESQVKNLIRDEIKYLREHGSFIETPSRRSGAKDG
jgi:hypothetical protein